MLLKIPDQLAPRVDAKSEPVAGAEILLVFRRRFLARTPDPRAASAAGEAYADEITKMRAGNALNEADRCAAEDERIALRNCMTAAYPFQAVLEPLEEADIALEP